jgi:hypothetical protein
MLTISKLKRWSINYYIETAAAAEDAARGLTRASGGLGEYYSERETRTPVWLLAGETRTVATLVGLTESQRAGGDADAATVARWLDDGIAPNGARGRAFGERGGPPRPGRLFGTTPGCTLPTGRRSGWPAESTSNRSPTTSPFVRSSSVSNHWGGLVKGSSALRAAGGGGPYPGHPGGAHLAARRAAP